MDYTPTNWKTGDSVTAKKLNKIEQAVASASGTNLITDVIYPESSNRSTPVNSYLNKTVRELITAYPNVYARIDHGDNTYRYDILIAHFKIYGYYLFSFIDFGLFQAADLDDYPEETYVGDGPMPSV